MTIRLELVAISKVDKTEKFVQHWKLRPHGSASCAHPSCSQLHCSLGLRLGAASQPPLATVRQEAITYSRDKNHYRQVSRSLE
eukprot:2199493-Amphidinium_carterae.1